MRRFVVPCRGIQTEAAFWIAYVEAAQPEEARFFGKNLDAFWDALNCGPGWPGECEVRLLDSAALGRRWGASVPQSSSYLDKIVQIRMLLPSLSIMARNRLVNDAIALLQEDATQGYFPKCNDRLSMLYFAGLRELLEQPRDVIRVFNTVPLVSYRI
jgi:RNAse (barnase) inhibitor barstar